MPDREMKKIRELELAIADEEYLFAGKKLTQKERDDLDHKKNLLRLAKEKKADKKDDGYQMPVDEFRENGKIDYQSQLDLLKARYLY